MKRKVFYVSALFTMCLLFALGMVDYVQAATDYKVIYTDSANKKKNRTVGKNTFEFDAVNHKLYAIRDGKKTLLAEDVNLSSGILTNGKVVYYCIDNSYQESNYKNAVATIYCITNIGETGKNYLQQKPGTDSNLKDCIMEKFFT